MTSRILCPTLSLLCTLLTTLFFWTPQAHGATTPSPLLLSEVQIAGSKADDEFVEIYNPNSCAVDIKDWKLKRRNQSGTETSATFATKTIVPGKQHFLWVNTTNESNMAPLLPLANQTNAKSSFLSANNSLGLFDKDGTLIDALTWGNNSNPFTVSVTFSPGVSFPTASGLSDIERDIVANTLHALSEPTPEGILSYTEASTAENTLCGTGVPPIDPVIPPTDDTDTSTDSSLTVRINEIFPNPKDKGEQGEFIELFNFGNEDIDLKGWTLRDASKTGKYTFPSGSTLKALGYSILYRPVSSISLNNTNETVTLFDPKQTPISSITYDKAKENVSYGYTDKGWRWSKYLTPGEENRFGKKPTVKVSIPKQIHPNIPATFSFEKDDSDFEYTWDFGDKSSKSHLSEVRHTYKKTGKYTVKATVLDGSEETTRSFRVQVKKFPSTAISITALFPNPEGGDTENEWLEISNLSDKKVDLKGWIIATGQETLTNHSIRESFVLEPKTSAKLTRDFASFTLGNKSMHIELRTPDKKTIQTIKYAREDNASEGEVYTKTDQGWVWQKTQESTPESETAQEDILPEDEAPTETIPAEETNETPQPEIFVDPEWVGKQSLAPTNAQPIASVMSYGTGTSLPLSFLNTLTRSR